MRQLTKTGNYWYNTQNNTNTQKLLVQYTEQHKYTKITGTIYRTTQIHKNYWYNTQNNTNTQKLLVQYTEQHKYTKITGTIHRTTQIHKNYWYNTQNNTNTQKLLVQYTEQHKYTKITGTIYRTTQIHKNYWYNTQNNTNTQKLLVQYTEQHKYTKITGTIHRTTQIHKNYWYNTQNNTNTQKLLVQYTEQHKYTKINDNEPTYTNDATGKEDVKDLIFASPKMMETFRDFWVDEDLGSDHREIIATFSSQPLTHDKPKKKILYHKADWTAINNAITNAMTKLHLDHTSSTETIDNYTSTLTSVTQTTIKQNVPQIEIKTHSTGIDKTTQYLITEEKQLRKLWQRTRIQHYKTEYNKLNNKIKHRIKTIKTKNWHNICNDLELTDNQDNTWHQLKENTKIKRTTPHIPHINNI